MAHVGHRARIAICVLLLATAHLAAATPLRIDPTPAALARAMQGHRMVLLGEVHDNAAQHVLRAAALRRLVAAGARPAIAFEQFDREHQSDIDRARRERPRDVDHLLAQAHADRAWHWEFYRPFVALALEFDLPIIAANLSRADAIKVASDGWRSAFDATTISDLGLENLAPALLHKQEQAIAAGHCNLLPTEMLAPRARAQIARDIAIARSIQPYSSRGVVLLAGNGHVQRDIGVPFWLSAEVARGAISIGLLERDVDRSNAESIADFDAYVITDPAQREDPCAQFRQQSR